MIFSCVKTGTKMLDMEVVNIYGIKGSTIFLHVAAAALFSALILRLKCEYSSNRLKFFI